MRFSNSIRRTRRSHSRSGTSSGPRKASSRSSAGQSRSIASIRKNPRSSRRFRRRASIPRSRNGTSICAARIFLTCSKFPEITFKSRRVKQTGPNTGEIIGDLTMHGVTRTITLHAQLLGDGGKSDQPLAHHHGADQTQRVWIIVEQKRRSGLDDRRRSRGRLFRSKRHARNERSRRTGPWRPSEWTGQSPSLQHQSCAGADLSRKQKPRSPVKSRRATRPSLDRWFGLG